MYSLICMCMHTFVGPPVIIMPPKDQLEVNNGDNIVFMCGALAFPEHQVSWTFTNAAGVQMLIISTEYEVELTKYLINHENGISSFGTLTVLNVNFDDRGTYSGNASNAIGYVNANTTLTIHGKKSLLILPHHGRCYTAFEDKIEDVHG